MREQARLCWRDMFAFLDGCGLPAATPAFEYGT
jgi:hypothetical protein